MSSTTLADLRPAGYQVGAFAAKMAAKMAAMNLSQWTVTLRRANGRTFAETFWAYPDCQDASAASLALDFKATVVKVEAVR